MQRLLKQQAFVIIAMKPNGKKKPKKKKSLSNMSRDRFPNKRAI